MQTLYNLLVTVKEATLIFISGRESVISSAIKGKSGFNYNLVTEMISCLSVQTCAYLMKILRIHGTQEISTFSFCIDWST